MLSEARNVFGGGMSSNKVREAEGRVVKLMKSKEPMTRETAMEGLAALLAAGRMKAPTKGGPPPRIRGLDEENQG